MNEIIKNIEAAQLKENVPWSNGEMTVQKNQIVTL